MRPSPRRPSRRGVPPAPAACRASPAPWPRCRRADRERPGPHVRPRATRRPDRAGRATSVGRTLTFATTPSTAPPQTFRSYSFHNDRSSSPATTTACAPWARHNDAAASACMSAARAVDSKRIRTRCGGDSISMAEGAVGDAATRERQVGAGAPVANRRDHGPRDRGQRRQLECRARDDAPGEPNDPQSSRARS